MEKKISPEDLLRVARCSLTRLPLNIMPRRFSSGSAFLLVLIIGGALLIGCSSVKDRQTKVMDVVGDVAKTATGALNDVTGQVKDVVDMGKDVVDTVQDGIDGVKKRVDAVEEGLEKIKEGKEKLSEGLGG